MATKQNNNLMGALAYLFGWLSGVVLLLVSKDSFVRFHAAQSIVVFGLINVVMFVPFLNLVLAPILGLLGLVLWLVLMFKAYQGEKWVVPVVGKWAQKLIG